MTEADEGGLKAGGADRAPRRKRLAEALAAAGISCACFRDEEGARDPAIRYLTGHPGDAVLFLSSSGESVLAAWDFNLARRMADVDRVLAYGDYGRTLRGAIERLLPSIIPHGGGALELPARIRHTEYLEIGDAFPGLELLCDPPGGGAGSVARARAIKDPSEIDIYRRAAAITDALADEVAEGVASGGLRTEADAALALERRARELGCEGMGFETLCAGPARSFGIHAFPPWTAGPFGAPGLSILDFGVKLEGYATDVTMTVARGRPSPRAERMLAIVEECAAAIEALLRPGAGAAELMRAAQAVFGREGFSMPHALGHGIGLEAHEDPVLRDRPGNDWRLESGMVIAVEPGLYDPDEGGVRFENDYLITDGGAERLTRSRIVRL